MPNPARALLLTLAALALLPACKTVRTERWESGSGDKLSEKFVGQSMDRWNSGEQHEMDRKRVRTEDVFGGDHLFVTHGFRTSRFDDTFVLRLSDDTWSSVTPSSSHEGDKGRA